jgi:hypothetical protein
MPRAFVVGNGVSLKDMDLDPMAGEVSFAMNRIHLLYDRTKWRPTYWIYTDIQYMPWDMWLFDVLYHASQHERCFLHSGLAARVEDNREPWDYWHANVTYVHPCIKHPAAPKSWHLPELCQYGTCMSLALQLAVLSRRFNPIYIVGADLGFHRQTLGEPDVDHFDEKYLVVDKHVDWRMNPALKNETLRHAHTLAKAAAEEQGIQIFNATVGGELEVYERVDFYSLFRNRRVA